MIAIEDQFSGVEISEDQQDHLVIVGDLVRFVEAYQPNSNRPH
jgi:acyl carrier protein